MASVFSISVDAIAQLPARHRQLSSLHSVVAQGCIPSSSSTDFFTLSCSPSHQQRNGGASAARIRPVVICVATAAAAAAATTDIPTVADTKAAFLDAYRRPIPSIYNNVIQELLVQQHLMRYNTTYKYDPVFALGFVTVYDQLMDGYPSTEDRDSIFKAYVAALTEDPEQYRSDAKMLEEWASQQTATSIVSFGGEGEVEGIFKDIAERAGGKGSFHYSRFFAIGLFRLLEVAKASDPAILEQFAKALNVNKLSIDRDLDVYRNLLSKLAQAKELVKEYVDREKKKAAERESAATKKTEEVAKTEAKSE